jgi:hypothetical protein
MSRGIKKTNSYQNILSREFLEKCPKSVLAAIAVSFVINHQGTDEELAEETLLQEWHLLHKNGTIPQKPFRENKNAEDLY